MLYLQLIYLLTYIVMLTGVSLTPAKIQLQQLKHYQKYSRTNPSKTPAGMCRDHFFIFNTWAPNFQHLFTKNQEWEFPARFANETLIQFTYCICCNLNARSPPELTDPIPPCPPPHTHTHTHTHTPSSRGDFPLTSAVSYTSNDSY